MSIENIPNPISVDFVPGEKLREVQKIECDILGQLLKVCQKHNLRVWAHAGTLLGAIRHRGFIPWDDDIDVVMLREDYDKLLEIGPREFKEPYFFQSAYTDKDYIFPHAQIRRSDTTAIMPITFRQKFNQGIFVDIFVLDAANEDMNALDKQYKKTRLMQTLMYWRYYWYTAKKWYVRCAAYLYHIIALCFNHRKWYKKIENVARQNQTLPHKHVASIMFNTLNVSEKLFPLTDFKETLYIPYEDIEIPIPNGYHNILCRLFGDDYMTPKHIPTMHGNDIIFDTKMPYTEYIRTHSK